MLQAEARFVSKHNVIPFRFPFPPFIASFEGAKACGLQSRLNETIDVLWTFPAANGDEWCERTPNEA
ncbi:hypothetical protein TNCV_3534881 [Trichonephila clavipes]|nr:hypothetical protein TNCV_3534881 [Trichonephila clavipes]